MIVESVGELMRRTAQNELATQIDRENLFNEIDTKRMVHSLGTGGADSNYTARPNTNTDMTYINTSKEHIFELIPISYHIKYVFLVFRAICFILIVSNGDQV